MNKIKSFISWVWGCFSPSVQAHLISAAKTFVATFISTAALAVIAVPADKLFSPEVLSVSFVLGIIYTAARTAVKIAWESLA